MKIYTADQMAAADQATIKTQNISSLELMERAASLAFSEILKNHKDEAVKFQIFCGIGNNGGDGLVIARKLAKLGYEVRVHIIEYSKNHSADFQTNLNRLKEMDGMKIGIFTEDSIAPPSWGKEDVLIDAIFGYGLNRPMPDFVNLLVDKINGADNRVYAIDLPSGMYANLPPEKNQPIIKADETLTFQAPKLSFYLPETSIYTSEIKVLNIGLDQSFLNGLVVDFEVLEKSQLQKIRKKRDPRAHKGNFGHCLIIGGSYGMMGSMVLATRAALRAGAGKVSSYIPKCGVDILQISAPEAMVLTGKGKKQLKDFKDLPFVPEAISAGMGMGTSEASGEFLLELMKATNQPMLLDADALNILSKNPNYRQFIPAHSILTPHPKELERLIGDWENDFEKIEKTKGFCKEYNVIVLIKGANTMTVTQKKSYINTTGNPGMATGGSGDVLSGLIGGLLSQGYSSLEAAQLGVWLHGRAGDLLLEETSEEAMIAGDLVLKFGHAFKELVE